MPLVMTFRENGQATVVELAGDLDSSVSLRPEDKARLFALLKPGCRITLDVTKLRRVSPVGLRLLLLLYRSARALGVVSFVGERRELVDLAEATGFVDMAQGPSPDPTVGLALAPVAAHRHLPDAPACRVRPPVRPPVPPGGLARARRCQLRGLLPARALLHPGAVRARGRPANRRDSIRGGVSRRSRLLHVRLRPVTGAIPVRLPHGRPMGARAGPPLRSWEGAARPLRRVRGRGRSLGRASQRGWSLSLSGLSGAGGFRLGGRPPPGPALH